MKLIIFFVIGFLNLSEIITTTFYSKGQLSKDNVISVKEQERCVYLDTNEIGNSGEIKIKVTTYNSFFMENVMHYGGSDNIVDPISLTTNKTFDSYSSSQSFYYDFRTFYLEFSYYFYIPIPPSQRYLYVSIPKHSMYATTAYTEIRIESGSSLFIPKGAKHRLTNTDSKENLIITEVQIGDYLGEDDIVRYEDNYGRV